MSESGRKKNKEEVIDKTAIAHNRYKRKYVSMKERSGETITSPCWSSKLCQVGTLTKKGIELMKISKGELGFSFILLYCYNN